MHGEVWRLTRGAELVGEIEIGEADFPWLAGTFRPGPGYPAVAPWFAETLALLEAEEHEERFDEAYDRIAEALTLSSPEGPVAEFLLHIDGDQVWFRWSDEPFDED
ncbi:hypothetical protein AB0442_41755 [Kitasatospora sp. NPDC085895]|uniref:hypothetical protein n=1 Tax=Kitasatospora sp. NPDC085895 TaxID=3155057 RepID=UPI00344D254B